MTCLYSAAHMAPEYVGGGPQCGLEAQVGLT